MALDKYLRENPLTVISVLVVVLLLLVIWLIMCDGEHYANGGYTNKNGPNQCADYLDGYTGVGGLRKCTMRQDSSLNFSAQGPN